MQARIFGNIEFTNNFYYTILKSWFIKFILLFHFDEVWENWKSRFFLKNRDPENWADRQEVQHNLNLANVLQDASARVIEGQYEKISTKRDQFLTKESDNDKK